MITRSVRLDAETDEHLRRLSKQFDFNPVSYTHLRAHETHEHLVCRLLLEQHNSVLIQLNTLTSHHTLMHPYSTT